MSTANIKEYDLTLNYYDREKILELMKDTDYEVKFNPYAMKLAVDEANTCLTEDGCGPFGACLLFRDILIGVGHNKVVKNNDPTCHAEIDCIRNSCQFLQTYDLSGCVLYSSCEPCPMCLTACKWANIKHIYYANTQKDADKIGFRDQKFYEMFKDDSYKLSCTHIEYKPALDTFEKYSELNKVIY